MGVACRAGAMARMAGTRVRDLMAQNGYHTPFINRRATFDHLGMQLDWIFLRNLAQFGRTSSRWSFPTTMRWWQLWAG